jgi:hypothetical protein
MKIAAWIVALVAVLAIVFTWFLMSTSYNNKYSALVAEAKARQDVSKVTFDNTWKVISGQAKVAEKERESFRTTFIEIMNARRSHR